MVGLNGTDREGAMPDDETLKRFDELHDRLDDVLEALKEIDARLDESTSKFELTAQLIAEIHGTWNIETGGPGPTPPAEETQETTDTINAQLMHLQTLTYAGHLTQEEYQERRQQLVERLDELYRLE
jgi:hypothetical protein